jgi:hypothetical protein
MTDSEYKLEAFKYYTLYHICIFLCHVTNAYHLYKLPQIEIVHIVIMMGLFTIFFGLDIYTKLLMKKHGLLYQEEQ